jgi:23S rRNA (pseudouridine1915-N3)-methyltransferase
VRLRIVSAAGKMPAWVETAVADYAARMPRELRVDWVTVPLAKSRAVPAVAIEREGQSMLARVAPADHVVAMEVNGMSWSTAELAQQLSRWQHLGSDVALLIGGPDGLSQACRDRAVQQWSMSALTLPHALVRVLLAEQLYRAWAINANHPYHRA